MPNSRLRGSLGTRKLTRPSSFTGLMTMTWPPRRRTVIRLRSSRGWFDAGIAADQHVEVAVLDVFELHRRRARAQARRQADAARLMAVVRAVVDVVRAEHPRKQLQQEPGLVRRTAAGVEEAAAGTAALQRCRQLLERLVPGDDAVVRRARRRHRSGRPAGRRIRARAATACAAGRSSSARRTRARCRRCMSDAIACSDFLQTSGKVAGLVDHPAHLAAHAERAGLARVPAAHRAPQRQPADAVRHAQRVEDRAPAAGGCRVHQAGRRKDARASSTTARLAHPSR